MKTRRLVGRVDISISLVILSALRHVPSVQALSFHVGIENGLSYERPCAQGQTVFV